MMAAVNGCKKDSSPITIYSLVGFASELAGDLPTYHHLFSKEREGSSSASNYRVVCYRVVED